MAIFTRIHKESQDLVSRHIWQKGYWEIGHPAEMTAHVSSQTHLPNPDERKARGEPRPTFVDLGENIGFISLLFAHHGFDVISVEASLCLNPHLAHRVTRVPAALVDVISANMSCVVRTRSAFTGGMAMGNGKLSFSGGEHCERISPGEFHMCDQVPTTAVDAILSRLGPRSVDVLKVDTEGYECKLLGRVRGHYCHGTGLHWCSGRARSRQQTDACMKRTLRAAGSAMGKAYGPDKNTVAWSL